MDWASTMAGNADNAESNRISSDDSAQDGVSSGSWDPHQVWLTRVKQPRDNRPRLPARSAHKLAIESPGSHFWTRAAR
ncbi:MAG: hypothetical protein RL261_600 [Pseudomonadota bacterium]|jgi:hypothetical protein